MSKIIFLILTLVLMSCQVEKKSGKDDYIADHRNATNSFSIKTNHAGTFKTADVLTFTLTFPSIVTVTGTPRLALEIDSNTRYADFVSGDQSKTLTFSYTIVAGDNDADGIKFSSINLNGATLKFYLKEVLTDCSTSIKAVHYKNILIDNTAPTITQITHALKPGIHYWNDVLTFSVKFSEKVLVTGTPTLPVTFTTGGEKQFQYVSGSGSNNLIFKYTIENNIRDTNGLGFAPISVVSAAIKDTSGNSANLALPGSITATNLLIIDGTIPKILEVELPPNGTYKVSQHLDFTVVFDRPVTIAGSPFLQLTVGTSTQQATYFDGSGSDALTFRYTPLPGHVDADGITLINSIQLPATPLPASNIVAGGRSVNAIPENNNLKSPITSGIIVQAIQPAIQRITRGTDTTLRINNNTRDDVWIIGQELHLIAEFNTVIKVNVDNGFPTMSFAIGGVTKTATYLTGGEGAASMTFVYIIEEGDNSLGSTISINSIATNNAVILDEAGTVPNLSIPNTTVTQTTIDGIRPFISVVQVAPADGFYRNGHETPANTRIDTTLRFSEDVNIPSNQVGIDISLNTGGTVKAGFSGANNTQDILFRYLIPNTVEDLDGISLQTPLNVGAHVIKDLAGNAIANTAYPVPTTTNVIIDRTPPRVSSISSQPSSGLYLVGNTLNFQLTFDETVTINSVDGYPRIPIGNMSPSTRYLSPTFAGTQTGTIFNFSYTIQNGDFANSAITLGNIQNDTNSYIRDRATNNSVNVPLTLSSAITIDAEEVKINSSSASASGYYRLGDDLSITLNFSENVFVEDGTPSITATVSGTDYIFTLASGDGTSALVFTHTITNETLRLGGLGTVSGINLNGATIQDNHGIDAIVSFSSLSLSDLKITPAKILAWSQGTVNDIISETNLFSGSFNLDGTNSLSTTAPAVRTILTRVIFKASTGSITGDITFNESTSIILSDPSNRIASVRVDGFIRTRVGNDFDLAVAGDTEFILEIELNAPFSGTLFDTGFRGSVSSIVLANSSLNATERSALSAQLN